MSFDVHAYHVEKAHHPNYLASGAALNSPMWQHTDTGIELANESDQTPFIGVIVGRVSPFRLKCGPSGNHIEGKVSPLTKSKYQFHITRPADHDLAADYHASIATLEALQKQVARTCHIPYLRHPQTTSISALPPDRRTRTPDRSAPPDLTQI
ncbi:hypothetical protein DFH29DRAFT_1007405 [Suillus ampliporus]|nr:hypothetical protein DFH29DRAFT_1007405 [Suillus ampliporus]